MRRLAEVGITTREACGNTVRNVTCCPHAGVCQDEAFDVSPHAHAMTYFLLRHPDAQNFGRKFKISFSGCESHSCGLGRMHDIGAIARLQDGVEGFQVLVGGGLGALPHQAKVYSEFVPADQMLPMAQAISRVFARLGEKKIRAKARMKFLVAKQGIDEFRRLVDEERDRLLADPRWKEELRDALAKLNEEPLKPPSQMAMPGDCDPGLREWLEMNVRPQRQDGYSMVDVFLPLGDISSEQARQFADLSRRYVKDTLRTTVDQNLMMLWVSNADLPDLYRDLKAIGLAESGVGRLKGRGCLPGDRFLQAGNHFFEGAGGALAQAIRQWDERDRQTFGSQKSRSAAASTPAASITSRISASSARCSARRTTPRPCSRSRSGARPATTPIPMAWRSVRFPRRT